MKKENLVDLIATCVPGYYETHEDLARYIVSVLIEKGVVCCDDMEITKFDYENEIIDRFVQS